MKIMPVISYTRTVGYFAPITNVNAGKREEIRLRKLCNVNNLSNLIEKQPKKDLTLSDV